MTSVGERIRQARLRAGLSQPALGGSRYTASYISHLEHDRRCPSPEMLEYLAGRLNVPVEDLSDPMDAETSDSAQLHSLESQIDALSALLEGERRALDSTDGEGTPTKRDRRPDWALLYLEAQTTANRGEYANALPLTARLLELPATLQSAALHSAALALRSRVLRTVGDLEASLVAADQAVELAEAADSARSTVARARLAQLSTLAELGRNDRLRLSVQSLTALEDGIPSSQLRGMVAWAIGNAYFLLGDVHAAIAAHDRASDLLKPDADLRAWARFHKASASKRIAAGETAGVERLLDAAAAGLALVGNADDLAELQLTRAESVLSADPERATKLAREALSSTPLPAHTRADATSIIARATGSLHGSEEARRHWVNAAELYEEAGALDKAGEIWRAIARGETLAGQHSDTLNA